MYDAGTSVDLCESKSGNVSPLAKIKLTQLLPDLLYNILEISKPNVHGRHLLLPGRCDSANRAMQVSLCAARQE